MWLDVILLIIVSQTARHLTSVIEIIGGDLKKTIMIGDSEVDAKSAENASLPFILLKDGYTRCKSFIK